MESTPSVRQAQTNVFEFVKDQLSANPSESKKFIMALVGIMSLVLCFFASAILFFYRPDLGPHLVAILTILIPSVAGIVGIYLGAQGAVEVKANGVLQHQAQQLADKL
jgi:hypothetical protein